MALGDGIVVLMGVKSAQSGLALRATQWATPDKARIGFYKSPPYLRIGRASWSFDIHTPGLAEGALPVLTAGQVVTLLG